jgi:transcriptional regulator with XRE-family HTH domain
MFRHDRSSVLEPGFANRAVPTRPEFALPMGFLDPSLTKENQSSQRNTSIRFSGSANFCDDVFFLHLLVESQSIAVVRGSSMIIGDKLKWLREHKNLSQGDIEHRTGMLRCYISRVENGHTVPSVETLEKFAQALEVPLYEFFYDGSKKPPVLKMEQRARELGSGGREEKTLNRFRKLLQRASTADRNLLIFMAQKTSQNKVRNSRGRGTKTG